MSTHYSTLGRKKSRLESEIRIEPTIPKVPVIGLDYSRRQTSNVSGFDSMSSITAIYSQINRPLKSKNRPSVKSSFNTTSNGITAANAATNPMTDHVTNHLSGHLTNTGGRSPVRPESIARPHSLAVHRMPNGIHAIQLSDNDSLDDNLAEYVLSSERKSRK